MATLDSSFEADLRASILDQAQHEFVGRRDSFIHRFVQVVHRNLRAYAQRHGYDVESTIESLEEPTVRRTPRGFAIEVGWSHPQMARWEFGTSDHTVEGDPLAFVWHDPPDWVREEFDQARDPSGRFARGYQVFLPETDVSGLPESRSIRDTLHAFRRVIES